MNQIISSTIGFVARFKIIILVLLIIVGGLLVFKVVNGQKTSAQLQTQAVERGTLVSSVSASGTVLSTNVFTVTTQSTGIVKKVYVKDGDKVVEGQKIAEIILDQDGQQKSNGSFSSYLSTKNSLDLAYTSQLTLHSQMVLAQQKLADDIEAKSLNPGDQLYMQDYGEKLAAETKYKNQQSVIEQAKIALSSAWVSYQETLPTITAPASGIVRSVGLIEGTTIESQSTAASSTNSQNTASQTVAVIQKEENPIVSVDLTEMDIAKVKVDQKAVITFDSLANKTFTGKVVTVDRIGEIASNVTSYQVKIQLDTFSLEILPNMAATANIILETKNDVLMVPSSAIQVQNNQSYVKTLVNGQEKEAVVETGISSDTQTEIVSGLQEGDEVIIGTINNNTASQSNRSVFSGSIFGGSSVGGSVNRQTFVGR